MREHAGKEGSLLFVPSCSINYQLFCLATPSFMPSCFIIFRTATLSYAHLQDRVRDRERERAREKDKEQIRAREKESSRRRDGSRERRRERKSR
jgi:hypothetical protein